MKTKADEKAPKRTQLGRRFSLDYIHCEFDFELNRVESSVRVPNLLESGWTRTNADMLAHVSVHIELTLGDKQRLCVDNDEKAKTSFFSRTQFNRFNGNDHAKKKTNDARSFEKLTTSERWKLIEKKISFFCFTPYFFCYFQLRVDVKI